MAVIKMLKIALIALILLSGCATYTPQRIEVCTDVVMYDTIEAYNKAAPNLRLANADGYYRPWGNEVHVMKWDFETLGTTLL